MERFNLADLRPHPPGPDFSLRFFEKSVFPLWQLAAIRTVNDNEGWNAYRPTFPSAVYQPRR